MIHRLVVLDRQKSIGTTLFDDNLIKLQSELLIGLVQALMLIGEELGPTKGALREAELGRFQIGILSKDHLCYIAVQDAFDSEPFTSKILDRVVNEYHETFKHSNFNLRLKDEEKIRNKIMSMLTTMKFPKERIPDMNAIFQEFDLRTNSIADTFLLVDLDDGIIEIFRNPENENIIRILMEILSEIPFERHWIGESKLISPITIKNLTREYEGWIIYRIGLTDFCFIGRVYYNHGNERDQLVNSLEELIANASNILLNS